MLLVRFHATIQGQALDPSIRARLNVADGTMRSTARGLAGDCSTYPLPPIAPP